MEPTGLAVGLIGLTGLFSSCVECFEYVQLGRRFAEDYGKCLLRLQVAKLRLVRWAEATGLVNPQLHEQFWATVPPGQISIAAMLLRNISQAFSIIEDDARKVQKYSTPSVTSEDVDSCDPPRGFERFGRLFLQIQARASRLQHSTPILKKTKWALFEKKQFDRLDHEVNDFINMLVELFPSARPAQIDISKADIQQIDSDSELSLLKEAAERDPILAATVSQEECRRSSRFQDLLSENNAEVHAGDWNYGFSHPEGCRVIVSGVIARDKSTMHLGNVNIAAGSNAAQFWNFRTRPTT